MSMPCKNKKIDNRNFEYLENNRHRLSNCQTHRLSTLCFFFPFRLVFHFQNAVDILLDNVVFLDLLFQFAIVGI